MIKLPVLKPQPEAAPARQSAQGEPGALETAVKWVFLGVYLGIILLGFFTDSLPTTTTKGQYLRSTRIFWTIGLPFAPMFMIVFGYYVWRRVCPLSLFAKLGARMPRKKQRRVPAWFERWGYMVVFVGMYFSLGMRMLFINGVTATLSVFLILIALSAFMIGAVFTGKTWCNFFCPVALIEKVYLEPTGMGTDTRAENSQCKKCTACKRHCPDIDVEMGYWKEKDILSRRMAAYGWPGLVFAFYWCFWTYRGTWDYYFSGDWTREPNEWRNAFGPGFFFLPQVPKLVAVYLSLAIPTLLSWGVFFAIERFLKRRYGNERGIHYSLSLAAFAAFNLFYLFAGQPTWRRIYIAGVPVGPYIISTLAIILSTWFFLRRFNRREDEAVQERFAKRFIARWQWQDEKQPEDLREAFYVIKHKEQEKEVGLRVYADTIRELLSEGVLTRAELRVIEQVRAQFNISDQDHEKVLSQLQITDQQLFDPTVAASAEERVQERGYRVALRALLLRSASKRDIDNLRREYDMSPENHQRIVDELTGKGGGHRQTVEDLLARIEDLRAVYRALCGFVIGPALDFLSLVLLKQQDKMVDAALDVLALIGMGELIRQHRPRLFDQDKVSRSTAIEALQAAGDPELMARLMPVLEERAPSYDPRELVSAERQEQVLDALASHYDPFVRAGAMLASALPGETLRPASIERLLSGMNDEDALIREAAIQALPTGWGMAADHLLSDTDRGVRDAAQAARQRHDASSGSGMPPSTEGAGGPQSPPLFTRRLGSVAASAGVSGSPPPPNLASEPQLPIMATGPAGATGAHQHSKQDPQPPPLSEAPPGAASAPQGGAAAKTSAPERIEIGEGFGGTQADTMVTGRFAVPRLPTNLGPVCTNLERILFLHCVPLFVDFEPEDLLVLARASQERGYTEGSILFNQGDVGDEVFVIISGRVQTIYAKADGESTAQTLGPGDCIGEMSVIDGSLRSTTAVVIGINTRVLAIAGATFRRFVEERAYVSGKIIGVLASQLRQLVERTERPLISGSAQPVYAMPAEA